jgi:Transposase DDE domain
MTFKALSLVNRSHRRPDRRDNIDHYRNLTPCLTCALKPRCTPDKVKRLKRWEHESVLDKMQARLDHMPQAMTIRRQTVEHPFGTLKAWMGSTHFLTKTLEKVKTEMSLQVLTYNMKRMISIFGAKRLMQAIAA